MFANHPVPGLLWRAYAVNSTVLALATLALAVSPATVSFPIALAEALVLAGGLAATLGLNLALLRGMFASAHDVVPATDSTAALTHPARADCEQKQRVLVCWTAAQHLSVEQAEAWASAELRRILAAEGLDAAHISRLRSASLNCGNHYDWLVEFDVAPGSLVESPAWEAWLGDLRALGLRPAAMVAEGTRVVTVETR